MADARPRLPVRVKLTEVERRRVRRAGFAPAVVVALAMLPFVATGAAGVLDLIGTVVVYGGLTGAAAATIVHDRQQARHCPSCGAPAEGLVDCEFCDYDLVERPRYVCDDRHRTYLGEGVCECGLQLRRLPDSGGIGPFVRATLVFGGVLLGLLVVIWLVLRIVSA